MAAREPVDKCESCAKELFENDLGFRYDDGPTFCEACSPTWADTLREYDELKKEGLFEPLFEEPEEAEGAYAAVLAKVAAGDGDKKHVWPL